MVQLDHEDVEALDQLEAEVAQGFEEQWQKVTELGEQQVTDAASGSKEAAGEIEANLGELRQKHDEAMAQLDKGTKLLFGILFWVSALLPYN